MGKLCKFGLVAVMAAVLPLTATTLQKLTLPEMAQKSTAVVRARVKASAGVLRGTDVYTLYRLEPVEVWKAPAAGVPREVAVPGGVAGGLRQPVDGAPALVEGREYVFFLWTSSKGLTQLIGLSQGLFDVRTAGGVPTVWRGAASERMLGADGEPVRDEAVSMKLGDLKAQVARALTGPVSGAGAGAR
jgi:hypothetical protein